MLIDAEEDGRLFEDPFARAETATLVRVVLVLVLILIFLITEGP